MIIKLKQNMQVIAGAIEYQTNCVKFDNNYEQYNSMRFIL